ncbi:hypothetical protein N657DRAFT_419961 [Parathielavia appendiculata]|uniref:Uncharacterized protein n=1 Tax=Parathielavia appendiculata TaxID=2587402 RepID=A0AAN6TZT1_9PEZI|nr:hypothetical protein N657DRAFT_419961 [Parathielavia appendiculata]
MHTMPKEHVVPLLYISQGILCVADLDHAARAMRECSAASAARSCFYAGVRYQHQHCDWDGRSAVSLWRGVGASNGEAPEGGFVGRWRALAMAMSGFKNEIPGVTDNLELVVVGERGERFCSE